MSFTSLQVDFVHIKNTTENEILSVGRRLWVIPRVGEQVCFEDKQLYVVKMVEWDLSREVPIILIGVDDLTDEGFVEIPS